MSVQRLLLSALARQRQLEVAPFDAVKRLKDGTPVIAWVFHDLQLHQYTLTLKSDEGKAAITLNPLLVRELLGPNVKTVLPTPHLLFEAAGKIEAAFSTLGRRDWVFLGQPTGMQLKLYLDIE